MKISSVVLVEDDSNFREAFASLINSSDHYYVKATYSRCEDAIANLSRDIPDIILMDIDLPGMDGISGCVKIKQQYRISQIVVITVHSDSHRVFKALCAGAVGYITKDSDLSMLLTILDEIRQGGAPMSIEIARMVVESFAKNTLIPLSSQETKILSLLSEGKSYKSIASLLSVSINTIKFHIKNIYVALQVANREEAIETAKKNKWI